MIKTKCVYSGYSSKADGFRVLVTRFRGRGLETSRYDAWVASLGPSEELLQKIQSSQITRSEFQRRYRKELFEPAPIDRHNRTIKNHGQKFTLRLLKALSDRGQLTLLCHCPDDQPHCHRNTLKKILESI